MKNLNNHTLDIKETPRDPRWEEYWSFIRQTEKDEENLEEYNKLTDTDYEIRK